MIDVKSGKIQLAVGLPAVLTAAIAFGDYRYVDHVELQVAMQSVTDARREDKLYSINKVIAKYKVTQSERKLKPAELQRLLDLESEASRLRRLLRDK